VAAEVVQCGSMHVDVLLLTRRGGVTVVMVVQCGSMHIDASLLTRRGGVGCRNGGDQGSKGSSRRRPSLYM